MNGTLFFKQALLPRAQRAIAGLEALQPLALLAARRYVAQAFWRARLPRMRPGAAASIG